MFDADRSLEHFFMNEYERYKQKQKLCTHKKRYRHNWATTICRRCDLWLNRKDYPENT